MLRGRARELGVLKDLLDAVRRGQSQTLVILGEPGIGKSALLNHLVDAAQDFTVVRAGGSESERGLPFAALQQLIAPLLEYLPQLPEPQREALSVAVGLTTGRSPECFLVSLGVLGLFSEASAEHPLLCVLDNGQWLDHASAQALGFVARRLFAEPVAMVFAAAEPTADLADLAELHVTGLRDDDARAVLDSALSGPLDPHVADRIIAETRGNPLALLELPKTMTPAELAGGFGVPGSVGVATRIEESFCRRFDALPQQTRELAVVAAAESTGDASLVWRAAELLGIAHDAVIPAATAGLLDITTRVNFRHPLARSAAYRGASPAGRQTAHQALAQVIDAELDPARRAWHRAFGSAGPDEEIAAELEKSAALAQARGGLAAAAAFLEKSVELTLDVAQRGRRAVAAADAKQEAGDPEAASVLLGIAQAAPLDDLDRARVDLVRARGAFATNRRRDAPALLLQAARRLGPLDAKLARQTILDAFIAALFAGRLAGEVGLVQVAEAARQAPHRASEPTVLDFLVDGLGMLITEGHLAAAASLKRILETFRSVACDSLSTQVRWLWLASRVAMEMWDDATLYELSGLQIELARRVGALNVLPIALRSCFVVELAAGRLEAATTLADEMESLTQIISGEPQGYGEVVLAAWRGHNDDVRTRVDASRADLEKRGEGVGLTVIDWALAVMHNGIGRYADAADAADRACTHPEEVGLSMWSVPELIEATVRNGESDRAAAALDRLTTAASISGTDWALGLAARSRALLSEDSAADPLYLEAISRLGRTRAKVDLARAHLVYGEWLRRQKRRLDAREHLRIAHEMFATNGLDGFAERCARELRATGGTPTPTAEHPSPELTPQEGQIARMARDGLSNADIGGRLFISPRTVEYHLRKVYGKLGISSRGALSRVPLT
jgi:DNA-binding CsgD family transcriptional regulator